MSIELGLLVTLISVILAYLGYDLNKTKQLKDDTQNSAKVQAELSYIRGGVDDIRIDQRANDKRINDMSQRVTRVEESTKQAHKRIDVIAKDQK